MKKLFLIQLTFLLCFFTFQIKAQDRPNIILIMSDDMGYSDLGCMGGEISTPNLDKLANDGLIYTQFYNVGHCCPSRASLMTGLYPHQTGLGWMTPIDYHLPGYTDELNNHCVTIAQVLKNAGYSTYMSGKWHLSHNTSNEGPKYNWPLQRGFEKFYGIISGAGNFYDPATLCRNNNLISPFNDPEYHSDNYYFTNAITDNAIKYLQESSGKNPFFMYVAYTAAHWPMQAPESEIQKYKGKYSAGWDVLRRQRLKRAKELGVIDLRTNLSPLDTHPWDEEIDKLAMERRMETYAAMISIMDDGIGKIVNELKKEGRYDNTIILFLQDNGGNAEGVGFGGPNGETTTVSRDTSIVEPLAKDDIQYKVISPITRDGKMVKVGKEVMAGPADTYLSYLKPWANLSNTPFQKYKNFSFEGGISSPLIVHWPKGIKSKGEIRREPGHEIDIMPTLVELAGASYPKINNQDTITPSSGVSLVPTFSDKALQERGIYFEHEANRAMRLGKWKIVSGGILKGPYGKWKTYVELPWHLFDLENDRSELTDLSGQYPDQVKKMVSMWEAWAKRTHVYPMPWKVEEKPTMADYMSTPWEYPNF
tara:strand:+ start:8177 stop:9952 length:1776 start_codon:yes stop_codon:yes gene_type:complete